MKKITGILFICLLVLPACKPDLLNSLLPPLEISGILIPPGKTLCHYQETIELEAVLELNQESPVTYAWICSAGVLSSNQGPRVNWSAPQIDGIVEITLFATHTLQSYTTSKTIEISVDASPLAPEEWETWSVGTYHVLPYKLRGDQGIDGWDWSSTDLQPVWTTIDFNQNGNRDFLTGVKRVRCQVQVYSNDGNFDRLYFGTRPTGTDGGFKGGCLLFEHTGTAGTNLRIITEMEFDTNGGKMDIYEYDSDFWRIGDIYIRLIGFYK